MDIGFISTIVAGVFGSLGVVVGFFLGKSAPKPPTEFKGDTATKSLEADKINSSILEVNNEIKRLKDMLSLQPINEINIKEEIKNITESLENIRSLINQKGINLISMSNIEESLNILKDLEIKDLSHGYENLLTSIKDNILVVRNEIQSLKLDIEDKKKSYSKIDVEKLKLAIKNAENINREAVKGDLLSLIHTIKGEDGSELKSAMDKIALESKELTLILRDILQNSSGVGK